MSDKKTEQFSPGNYRKEGRMCKVCTRPAVEETPNKLFLAWELGRAALSSSPWCSTQNLQAFA